MPMNFFFQMFRATAFSILCQIEGYKYFIIASKAMTFKFKINRRQIAETVVERLEQLQVTTVLATAWYKNKQTNNRKVSSYLTCRNTARNVEKSHHVTKTYVFPVNAPCIII